MSLYCRQIGLNPNSDTLSVALGQLLHLSRLQCLHMKKKMSLNTSKMYTVLK